MLYFLLKIILKNLSISNFNFNLNFKSIDEDALDLLVGLLELNPEKRLSATEAL